MLSVDGRRFECIHCTRDNLASDIASKFPSWDVCRTWKASHLLGNIIVAVLIDERAVPILKTLFARTDRWQQHLHTTLGNPSMIMMHWVHQLPLQWIVVQPFRVTAPMNLALVGRFPRHVIPWIENMLALTHKANQDGDMILIEYLSHRLHSTAN